MTTYLLHDTDGKPVSIGTVVADPLPAGLTAVTLSTEDADKLRTGWQWNPSTLAVDIEPPLDVPDPYEVYAQAIAEAQTMEEVRAAGAALALAIGESS